MGSGDATKRMHALFSGRVQGVGFRFTVCRIAAQFCVKGYVKNLWDGDVELVAEGTETVLVDFLTAVRNSQLRQYIARDSVEWQSATGEFDRFGVLF